MKAVVARSVAVLLAASMLSAASEPPIIEAIQAGDRAAVRRLLSLPGNADAVRADGTTALQVAAWSDAADLVEMLLRAGAGVNATSRHGVTALSLAALNGSPDVTGMLLAAGADPNIRLAEDQTILMTAARTGNAGVVRRLIAAGADVNARERVLGETAAMWAAVENHAEVIDVLAEAGADLDARSSVMAFPRFKFGDGIVARPTVLPKGGWTPLMYAARQNAIEAAARLAERGADLNVADPDGTSALVFAVINAHFDLAAMLVEKGADPNVADTSGMTALYAAVDMHTLDETVGRPNPRPHSRIDAPGLVRKMLQHGADPDARLRSPVLERLHNDGDPSLEKGATAFMRAAKDADVEAMRILLEHGADPHAHTTSQRTALMYAAGRQNGFRGTPNRGSERQAVEAVALCLDEGADVNATDAEGQTALHLAALQAEDSILRLLVARGANPRLADKRGRTPLDLALGGGRGGRGTVRPDRIALLTELTGQAPPR